MNFKEKILLRKALKNYCSNKQVQKDIFGALVNDSIFKPKIIKIHRRVWIYYPS